MAGQTPTSLTNLPTLVNEDGQVKKHRIRTVSELTSSYQTVWWADRASAAMRTINQQMRDGAPPYDPGRERLNGLGGRANYNFGRVEQKSMDAAQPINSLIDGVSYLCTMPTKHGSPNERMYWEETMKEEFTRSIMSWDQFTPLWQINARNYIDEGISIAFFEDDHTWMWDIKGLQHFVFPRRTRASVEFLDIVCAEIELFPSDLYSKCQNDTAAAEEGWDKIACWEAIKQAAQQHGLPSNDFQEWEKAWKDNDLFWGVTDITVEALHCWVKEVDGTVSHYIARKDGKGDFLYKSQGKYRAMSRMMIAYMMGVGTNNNFHSIRGLLARIAQSEAGFNKAMCRMLDRIWHDTTPFIKTMDEDTLTELPLMPMGMYAVLKPGAEFVEAKFADFSTAIIPAMNFLSQLTQGNSSSYTTSPMDDHSVQPKTKYEKQMQYAQTGSASTTAMQLFKPGFQRHMQEVVRRFTRRNYSSNEKGGWFVQDFKARCIERGVPEEAIYNIDIARIEVNMGLGKGSAVERKNVVDQLYGMVFQNLDAEGKNRMMNMVVSTHADVMTANMLTPLIPGLRPPQDEENAQLENGLLVLGQPVEVKLNQLHEIHLETHIPRMDQINQALGQQQITLEEAIPQLSALFQHSEIHFELLSPESGKRPMFKEQLAQFNQAITNGSKQLASQQMKMMKEAQHNAGKVGGETLGQAEAQMNGDQPGGTQSNASTFTQQVEASQSLREAEQSFQHHEESHQMKLALDRATLAQKQLEAQKIHQSMVLEDAKTAATITK